MIKSSEDNAETSDKDNEKTARSGTRGYPRRRSPIPEAQLARDRDLSRKLYRIIYTLPFLMVGIAIALYFITR